MKQGSLGYQLVAGFIMPCCWICYAVHVTATRLLCCACAGAGDKMQFARRVGLDLFRFLEGFATQASGDAILIPTNALDRCVHTGTNTL